MKTMAVKDIKSIRTLYKGCFYRSRLEATWAAFFDIMGWNYQYEPFDFNGWTPDFILIGKDVNTLVEVKPYTSLKEFESNGVIEKSLRCVDLNKFEILFLGCTVFASMDFDSSAIGYLCENEIGIDECILDENGFFHASGSWKNRISGEYDGDGHLKPIDINTGKTIFNEAQNKTRWNNDRKNN